jgi:ligand-binding SRPBCC domain-containing protein
LAICESRKVASSFNACATCRAAPNPANLKKITPLEMGFHILTPDLPQEIYTGLFIESKVSPLLGIPLTWVTEITQVEKGVVFCDEQPIGLYRIWSHKHFFAKEGRYTRMRDRVDYALPPVPLQGLLHRFLVRRKLNEIFDYRHKAVEKFFP